MATTTVDATFEGVYTGVLDRLDVDLHILVDSFTRLGNEQTLDIEVEVNGAPLGVFAETPIMPVPEEASQAGSVRLDFAVTGLAEVLDRYNLPNTADTAHQVRLKVGAFYLDQVTVYAFDTTEVPGGIGFNRVDIPQGTVVLDAS